MRRFRNVLFKLSREYSESEPQFDYVELDPVEDSRLHLAFLYDPKDGREIKVTVSDTWMMGQEVKPQSAYKIDDIEGGHVEQISEYKLTKGRHYALTVYYIGGTEGDDSGHTKCGTYDVTVSIAHIPSILTESACRAGNKIESLHEGLTHVITDRELDQDGNFNFDKLMKL